MNRTTEIKTIFNAFGLSILLLFFIPFFGLFFGNRTLGLKEPVKTIYSQSLERIELPDYREHGGMFSHNSNTQYYYQNTLYYYHDFSQMKEVSDIEKPSYKISVPRNWDFLTGSMGSKINLDRLNRPEIPLWMQR